MKDTGFMVVKLGRVLYMLQVNVNIALAFWGSISCDQINKRFYLQGGREDNWK